MRLCLSNLAWDIERDAEMLRFMRDGGFSGVEIAPTKLFGEDPYSRPDEAARYADRIKSEYAISVASMQSLWYGRKECIFEGEEERETLFEYTKSAIDLAETAGCGVLVFGCPKNRIMGRTPKYDAAREFFGALGGYAFSRGAVFALEANPAVYGTDFINTTREALEFCEAVGRPGLKINLDFGTIAVNNEKLNLSRADVERVGHVHISEPGLAPIKRRPEHAELRDILKRYGYGGYVSVEMGLSENGGDILEAAEYLREIFV